MLIYLFHMKMMSQMEVYRTIRKPFAPAVKIERPVKGRGYRRHNKWRREQYGET
jgi:hypothetical protein